MRLLNKKMLMRITVACILIFVEIPAYGDLQSGLKRLQQAYPNYVKAISTKDITWSDGSKMTIQPSPYNKSLQEKIDHPSLSDQLEAQCYMPGKFLWYSKNINSTLDIGRIRYEPFFRKMYGNTQKQVEQKLVKIYWMPKAFGKQYPLLVTTVNGVDKKFLAISSELEKLPVSYYKFLRNPAGTFLWRVIANTNRLSMHSFGMTIDLNTKYSDYWLWDLKKFGKPITAQPYFSYHHKIPWQIVHIFEKHGFIWGGKWYHLDTMHFEYRPELFCR